MFSLSVQRAIWWPYYSRIVIRMLAVDSDITKFTMCNGKICQSLPSNGKLPQDGPEADELSASSLSRYH